MRPAAKLAAASSSRSLGTKPEDLTRARASDRGSCDDDEDEDEKDADEDAMLELARCRGSPDARSIRVVLPTEKVSPRPRGIHGPRGRRSRAAAARGGALGLPP